MDRSQAKPDGVSTASGWSIRTNSTSTRPQTPGMIRAAAMTHARAGAEKFWAGTVVIHPKAKTGAHHHGPVESVIYVVSGRARMRWGDRLEFVAEAGPGDFIYVPPFVPHQEINASDDRRSHACWCAAARSPWSSISICRTSSRTRSRSSGSTTFIRPGERDGGHLIRRPPTGRRLRPAFYPFRLEPFCGRFVRRSRQCPSSRGLARRRLVSVLVPIEGEAFVEARKRELDADLRQGENGILDQDLVLPVAAARV